jgi:tRNA(Arg) A34 adenosine deaminase TadA
MNHSEYIQEAIQYANTSVKEGGGPFGAMVVDETGVLAHGMNQVTQHNDPTAHAEIQAIRAACKLKQSFDLSGTILYASCEPCIMCAGAIQWARINHVYYAAPADTAASHGFADDVIRDRALQHETSDNISFEHIPHEEASAPFEIWEKSNNIPY